MANTRLRRCIQLIGALGLSLSFRAVVCRGTMRLTYFFVLPCTPHSVWTPSTCDYLASIGHPSNPRLETQIEFHQCTFNCHGILEGSQADFIIGSPWRFAARH